MEKTTDPMEWLLGVHLYQKRESLRNIGVIFKVYEWATPVVPSRRESSIGRFESTPIGPNSVRFLRKKSLYTIGYEWWTMLDIPLLSKTKHIIILKNPTQ